MLWVIYRINKPSTEAMRAANLQVHRDYLHDQNRILVLSGPLQSDDGEQSLGSMLVVNVNGRAEAQSFADGDPLSKLGVFASVTITRMRKGHWNPQAAEGT